MESIYQAFAFSVVRAMLLVAGGWLVSRGLVDDGLMKEVAAGLALIVVTQVWSFIRIYRRQLYQRWLVLLGLRDTPATPVGLIEAEARQRVKAGWVP
jgi:hypothetical protein